MVYLLDDRVSCGHRQGVAIVDCTGSFNLAGLSCLRSSTTTPTRSPWWLWRASLLTILVCQSQNNWVLCSGCTHVYLYVLPKKNKKWPKRLGCSSFLLSLRCPYNSPNQRLSNYISQLIPQEYRSFVKHLIAQKKWRKKKIHPSNYPQILKVRSNYKSLEKYPSFSKLVSQSRERLSSQISSHFICVSTSLSQFSVIWRVFNLE